MNRENRRFQCVYTHQKTKKKKSWTDGQVHIYITQKKCVLYKWDDMIAATTEMMSSKFCSSLEIDRILNGQVDSLEFDKFLVEIDRFASVSDFKPATQPVPTAQPSTTSKAVSKLKLTKFQVPKAVHPPAPVSSSALSSSPISQQVNRPASSSTQPIRGAYAVHDDELDDIWNSTAGGGDVDQSDEGGYMVHSTVQTRTDNVHGVSALSTTGYGGLSSRSDTQQATHTLPDPHDTHKKRYRESSGAPSPSNSFWMGGDMGSSDAPLLDTLDSSPTPPHCVNMIRSSNTHDQNSLSHQNGWNSDMSGGRVNDVAASKRLRSDMLEETRTGHVTHNVPTRGQGAPNPDMSVSAAGMCLEGTGVEPGGGWSRSVELSGSEWARCDDLADVGEGDGCGDWGEEVGPNGYVVGRGIVERTDQSPISTRGSLSTVKNFHDGSHSTISGDRNDIIQVARGSGRDLFSFHGGAGCDNSTYDDDMPWSDRPPAEASIFSGAIPTTEPLYDGGHGSSDITHPPHVEEAGDQSSVQSLTARCSEDDAGSADSSSNVDMGFSSAAGRISAYGRWTVDLQVERSLASSWEDDSESGHGVVETTADVSRGHVRSDNTLSAMKSTHGGSVKTSWVQEEEDDGVASPPVFH